MCSGSFVIVEDIVDSGVTAEYLVKEISSRGSSGVSFVTLLNNIGGRVVNFKPDYVGFQKVLDAFVVGYGLDLDGKERNLPDIYMLDKDS